MQLTDKNWSLLEETFDLQEAGAKESLFAVGNGYIGVRGYFDEGYADVNSQCSKSAYLNGVYESLPIEYDESAYGFAENCHRIVDVPRHLFLVGVNGAWFSFDADRVSDFKRVLDFRTGVYARTCLWQLNEQLSLRLTFSRFASFSNRHLMMARLNVEVVDGSAEVEVHSVLDAHYGSESDVFDPRKGDSIPSSNWVRDSITQTEVYSSYEHRAVNSNISVCSTLCSQVNGITSEQGQTLDSLVDTFRFSLSMGQSKSVEAAVSYFDSRESEKKNLVQQGIEAASKAIALGFDAELKNQAEFLAQFWSDADIQIDSDDGAQYSTRFSLFHVLQSTGRDGQSSIAAKGVTGAGYDGHYFWDSETYLFPFWLFTQPDVAKSLLQYRVGTLPAARKRANELGHAQGALFAWRTIGGEECSSFFPAGTAQYHINADIAYAARSYYNLTNDDDFLLAGLAEVVLETARIWIGIGGFSDSLVGRFGIYCVTGPDEYTALVNNNFYTNRMAQIHLEFAVELCQRLQRDYPAEYRELASRIGLNASEIEDWRRAAEKMYFSENEQGVYAQDDSFFMKPKWDFKNTPKDKYPLLLNYHPLVIYRHQVLKQADTILALILAGDHDDLERKKKCYDYYEPINTHDSTLSTCVHGVLASEVGYTEQAYEYYKTTLMLDLNDEHRNTYYGVHTAAMGGVWMGAVQGFAGLRYSDGVIHFNPSLPKQWQSLSFKLRIGRCQLKITLAAHETTFQLIEGEMLEFHCSGRSFTIHADETIGVNE